MDNRRQYPRFSFTEPVGYQMREETPIEGALSEDISQMGLKVSVNEFIPLNSVLELQIRLPGQMRVIPARAKVVWVREMPYRDDSWQVGLQLTSSEQSSSVIRDYINLRRFEPV